MEEQSVVVLEIEGTPYIIESNLPSYSWSDLQDPARAKDIYATIYRVENGKRPIWQMEYKGSTAVNAAILSVVDGFVNLWRIG